MYTASHSDKSTPPSSVDERVPSPPITPPAAQLRHTVAFVLLKSPPLGQTTTTGLNPSSSSRFTLIWFLLEDLDPVSAIMESVAIMAADDSRIKLRSRYVVFLILSLLRSIFLPHRQPLVGNFTRLLLP